MESQTQIIVDILGAGLRADRFLVGKFPQISRSTWQKGFKNGWVFQNGKVIASDLRLKNGDQLELDGRFFAKDPELLADLPVLDLKIVFETPDWLVLEKPTGLLVHPTLHSRETTLTASLLSKYPEIAEAGDDPQRPGIVHRLDKDASGLLVVAKNQNAFEILKDQFKKHTVLKIYQVLVYGDVVSERGTLKQPIGRSGDGTKMSVGSGKDLKPAWTQYQTIGHYYDPASSQKFTLLEVKIKTGRTHQIRAHLHSIGHPVVGDKVYRLSRSKKIKNLPRLFLHSQILGFKDLRENHREFRSELPEDLDIFLKRLKIYHD